MGNRRLILDEAEIVRLYTEENKSALQISRIMGCSVMVIFRRLAKNNIPTKSQAEVMKGRTLSKEHRAKVIKTLQYGKKGADNPNWKGGRSWRGRNKAKGYIIRLVDGRYVPEHRVVMERYLGRKLTKHEHIHHVNGNRIDNRIENLQLMTVSEHSKLHMTPEHRAYMSKKITEVRQKKYWSSKKKLD